MCRAKCLVLLRHRPASVISATLSFYWLRISKGPYSASAALLCRAKHHTDWVLTLTPSLWPPRLLHFQVHLALRMICRELSGAIMG